MRVCAQGGADGEEEEDLGLPEDSETCLQINLVYQEVIEEKLQELEVLLAENREQQVRETRRAAKTEFTFSGGAL